MPHFTATADDSGKLTITASVAGDQMDTPQPTVIRGTGSDADETPTLSITDGGGGLDWSTPIEDGVNGTDGNNGTRGTIQLNASITLAVGVSAPVVGSIGFNNNTVTLIENLRGVDTPFVSGDIAIIVYTEVASDGSETTVTRSAIHNGGTGIDDWEAFAYQIDGNLLVQGTVVADEIRADSVISNNVESDPYNAGINGYSLNGTTGNAEFNNVTIRGESTVESTSISGVGVWGVSTERLIYYVCSVFC